MENNEEEAQHQIGKEPLPLSRQYLGLESAPPSHQWGSLQLLDLCYLRPPLCMAFANPTLLLAHQAGSAILLQMTLRRSTGRPAICWHPSTSLRDSRTPSEQMGVMWAPSPAAQRSHLSPVSVNRHTRSCRPPGKVMGDKSVVFRRAQGTRGTGGQRELLFLLYFPLRKLSFKYGLITFCQVENINGKKVNFGTHSVWVRILDPPLLVQSYLTFL